MGAVAWQRYFDSSDYAWYNLEEGRYTGISADWHISKWLSWYNGIEFGWGTFYDEIGVAPDYITQINLFLDEEAKNTKVWLTCLTGPTNKLGFTGNSTTVEVGLQHNWNKYIYQILDTQMTHSEAPIFGVKPPGYQERAYDVYTYIGAHLTCSLDFNTRFEWYKDVDGGGYPGGFGVPHTDYFETTLGVDYHPVKWVQFRPEIRYDYASHENFGPKNDKKNQLSIATELLLKF
jgi:Putative beta-barrel porin-2, OmpL-like. bbp2